MMLGKAKWFVSAMLAEDALQRGRVEWHAVGTWREQRVSLNHVNSTRVKRGETKSPVPLRPLIEQ